MKKRFEKISAAILAVAMAGTAFAADVSANEFDDDYIPEDEQLCRTKPAEGTRFSPRLRFGKLTAEEEDSYTVENDAIAAHEGCALVTLTAGDVWGDGTGYQLLLDKDANTFGRIIPSNGSLTGGGNVSQAVYDEFEYKVPEDADGILTTSNIVVNNTITIEIPAGAYDYAFTNPLPGDRMWIVGGNGNFSPRGDDYEFTAGTHYFFNCSYYGWEDGVDLETEDIEYTCYDGVPPTCTDKGSRAYYVDREGKYYIMEDDELKEIEPDDVLLPAAGHVLEDGIEVFDADCENDGEIEYICPVCGEYVYEIKPALGHSFDINGVCTDCGKRSDDEYTVTATASGGPAVAAVETPASGDTSVAASGEALVSAGGSSEGGSAAGSSSKSSVKGRSTGVYNGSSEIELTWDKVAGAYDYTVYLTDGNGIRKLDTTEETSYTYKNAELGRVYKFIVKYTTKKGLSKLSESYTVVVRTKVKTDK